LVVGVSRSSSPRFFASYYRLRMLFFCSSFCLSWLASRSFSSSLRFLLFWPLFSSTVSSLSLSARNLCLHLTDVSSLGFRILCYICSGGPCMNFFLMSTRGFLLVPPVPGPVFCALYVGHLRVCALPLLSCAPHSAMLFPQLFGNPRGHTLWIICVC